MRRRKVARIVSAAAVELGGSLDLRVTMSTVAVAMQRALRADRATCYVVSDDRVSAVFTTETDPRRRAYLEATVGMGPADIPIWRHQLARPDPLVTVGNVARDPAVPEGVRRGLGMGAFLGIRLHHESVRSGTEDDLLGTLFCSYLAPRRFTAVDRDAARALASVAGLALANARLHAETVSNLAAAMARAATDPLTGLANHRAFHERLASEVDRARRHGRSLAVALIDVDHFKEVNDAHGHRAGDAVLVELADRLAGCARAGDVVGRVGGEEFAWILPETTGLEALLAGERARDAIAARPVAGVGGVTVSAGVADLSQADDAEELCRLADTALYWAKDSGRNSVWRYSADVAARMASERAEETARHAQALGWVRALARAVDAKDHFTRRRSERVAELAERLALRLGWTPARARLLHDAALVHDVGKIGVPDAILLKPSGLTGAEYGQVVPHAALGAQIVAEVLSPEQTSWVRHHHERPDGLGYPDRLAGDEIPEGARVLGLADAWDAMTHSRIYRDASPPEEALAECRRVAGSQFCPACLAALEALWADGTLRQLQARWASSCPARSRPGLGVAGR